VNTPYLALYEAMTTDESQRAKPKHVTYRAITPLNAALDSQARACSRSYARGQNHGFREALNANNYYANTEQIFRGV
jgi:hypothetical protein